VKYAINGLSVFNHTTISAEPLPSPNRVKITPGYLNVTNMEIMVDDVEVQPPCSAFPCGAPPHID